VFHEKRLESLSRDKHSRSFLGPFLRYEENDVSLNKALPRSRVKVPPNRTAHFVQFKLEPIVGTFENQTLEFFGRPGELVTVLLNKSSCLASALGVTKFMIVIVMIWVTLCCATSVGLRCSTSPPLLLTPPLPSGHRPLGLINQAYKFHFLTHPNMA
jgi:hypothetical protein